MSTFPRSRALEAIRAKRNRQIVGHGYTAEHDYRHDEGELAQAAAAFAIAAKYMAVGEPPDGAARVWPADWGRMTPPASQREALESAGALILAELERLDREEGVS